MKLTKSACESIGPNRRCGNALLISHRRICFSLWQLVKTLLPEEITIAILTTSECSQMANDRKQRFPSSNTSKFLQHEKKGNTFLVSSFLSPRKFPLPTILQNSKHLRSSPRTIVVIMKASRAQLLRLYEMSPFSKNFAYRLTLLGRSSGTSLKRGRT